MKATAQTSRRGRRFMPVWLTALFAAVLLVPAAIAVAGSVTTAVVDTTSPEGSVTLDAGQSSAITIKATVQGAVEGNASFEVYRNWTLRNGTFEGSNPTTFNVAPRSGSQPAAVYSTAGTVTIASGQPEGSYNLQVSAMNITNSNQTGAKLGGGDSATYTITVNKPATPPEPPQPPADATPPAFLSMPSDTILEAQGRQGASMSFSASADDATDGSVPVSFWIGSQQITSPHTFPMGDTTVTLKATDKAGNLAEATFTVRVLDTTAPSVTAPADLTREATGQQTAVAMSGASASDLVDPNPQLSYWYNGNELSGSADLPLGEHQITIKAKDASGNTGKATWNVTIQDTTAPQLSLPKDATVEATGAKTPIDLTGASASDSVDPNPQISYWYNGNELSSPAKLGLGSRAITVRATDASGNSAEGSWNVTIQDTTAPRVNAPADATVEATGAKTPIDLAGGSASDLVDGSLTVSYWLGGQQLSSPAQLGLGSHTISVKATDNSGNTGSATWKVTIQDTTAPDITAPPAAAGGSAIEATSGKGASVDLSGASARDLVDGNLTVTYWLGGQQLSSPAQLPVGTSTITIKATDRSGNSASASYDVTVLYSVSSGFLQPINYTGTQSWFKAGSTIPIKFQLPWSGGYITDAVANISVAKISNNLGTVNETAITLAASSGTLFRYDATSNQYIYNLSTKNFTAGEYRITIDLNGGQKITVKIGLR